MPSAALHYFSGTGNTHRAIKIVEEKLKSTGFSVDVYRIAEGLVPVADSYDLHVFAYPVYALDMPAIMLRYMRKLPPGKSRAAVIAIFGDLKLEHPLNGDDGYAAAHAANVLRSKGYDVVFTGAVGYPHSITIGINPPVREDQEAIRARSDKIIDAMADQIIGNGRSYRRTGILNPVFASFGLMYRSIGRRALGKLYVADDHCVGCGKCVRVCPAGAIGLIGKVPRWNFKCEGCQRCINSCPHRAIQTSIVRLLGMLFLQIASLVTFIGLFFSPYGDYFHGIAIGPLQVSGWWEGFALALVVWAIVFVLLTRYVLDELVWLGEGSRLLRPIFHANFTHGYRRYLDPGFDPDEKGLKVSAQKK
jgi:menaquinone-dependent protoporphyrinogen IX oxidase